MRGELTKEKPWCMMTRANRRVCRQQIWQSSRICGVSEAQSTPCLLRRKPTPVRFAFPGHQIKVGPIVPVSCRTERHFKQLLYTVYFRGSKVNTLAVPNWTASFGGLFSLHFLLSDWFKEAVHWGCTTNQSRPKAWSSRPITNMLWLCYWLVENVFFRRLLDWFF